MTDVLILTMKLLFVQEVRPSGEDMIVVFVGGRQGVLPAAQKNVEYQRSLATKALARMHPVAVTQAAPDGVLELARADNDFPAYLEDASGKPRLELHFQGHDGIFYLERNHPEFDRLAAVLRESIRRHGRVWFVARKPTLIVVDVLEAPSSPAQVTSPP